MTLDTHPAVLKAKRLGRKNVMSGTYGIATALVLCSERVSLFGFTTRNVTMERRYHYFDQCTHDPRSDALSQSSAFNDVMGGLYHIIQIRSPVHHLVWHPLVAVVTGRCPHFADNSKLAHFLKYSFQVGRQRLPAASTVSKLLHVSTSPFVVLHGYWNRSRARAAREEVVRALGTCKQSDARAANSCDRRQLAITDEHQFPLLAHFQNDQYLLEVARHHHQGRQLAAPRAQASFTLPGESSGYGWHKDSLTRGIKAMMYLDNVDEANGPLAMLLKYRDSQLQFSPNPSSGVRRHVTGSVLSRLIEPDDGNNRVDELHATEGSVILFETSNVHRDLPSRHSERVSLVISYELANPQVACKLEDKTSEDSGGCGQRGRGARARRAVSSAL